MEDGRYGNYYVFVIFRSQYHCSFLSSINIIFFVVGIRDYMYKISSLSSFYLDLVRIISVQMVVFGHGITICSILLFLQPPNFVYIQNVAVVIFFLLSGFLITYSTMNKISLPYYSFIQYFIDRFSRIFSGLIPALLFIVIIDFFHNTFFPSSYAGYLDYYGYKNLIGNLFMFQNFPISISNFNFVPFGSDRPLWTLAIEWWIYMAFGWIIFKEKIRLNFFIYIFVLLFFLIVPMSNFAGGRGQGLFLTWLFGSLIYFVISKGKFFFKEKYQLITIIIIALILCAGSLVSNKWNAYNSLFACFIGIAILFSIMYFDSLNLNYSNSLPNKTIHLVAGFSYTLYLIHYSIFVLFKNLLGIFSPVQVFVIAFIVSNVSAYLIALFGEMKYRELSNYLKKRYLGRVSNN